MDLKSINNLQNLSREKFFDLFGGLTEKEFGKIFCEFPIWAEELKKVNNEISNITHFVHEINWLDRKAQAEAIKEMYGGIKRSICFALLDNLDITQLKKQLIEGMVDENL